MATNVTRTNLSRNAIYEIANLREILKTSSFGRESSVRFFYPTVLAGFELLLGPLLTPIFLFLCFGRVTVKIRKEEKFRDGSSLFSAQLGT